MQEDGKEFELYKMNILLKWKNMLNSTIRDVDESLLKGKGEIWQCNFNIL